MEFGVETNFFTEIHCHDDQQRRTGKDWDFQICEDSRALEHTAAGSVRVPSQVSPEGFQERRLQGVI